MSGLAAVLLGPPHTEQGTGGAAGGDRTEFPPFRPKESTPAVARRARGGTPAQRAGCPACNPRRARDRRKPPQNAFFCE